MANIDTDKKHEVEWQMNLAIHMVNKDPLKEFKKPGRWPDVGQAIFAYYGFNNLITHMRVQVPPSAPAKNKGSGKIHLPEPFSIFNRAVNKQSSVYIGIQYAYSLLICSPNG
ncbi:hypothetical protein [Desulfosarcina cetonica]|uniref:hypothetical protein n=1 Tax=Desulfosarcina cetonica TaxID=90730 RepID=UPI0012ED538E|nr:hypothetical protein [Desulfosarcina cetonica]